MKTQTVVSKKKILTYNLLEPLCEATTAKVDIDTASGNLTIDTLTEGEPLLASGTLEYTEKQGVPASSVTTRSGQASAPRKGPHLRSPGHAPILAHRR